MEWIPSDTKCNVDVNEPRDRVSLSLLLEERKVRTESYTESKRKLQIYLEREKREHQKRKSYVRERMRKECQHQNW